MFAQYKVVFRNVRQVDTKNLVNSMVCSGLIYSYYGVTATYNYI